MDNAIIVFAKSPQAGKVKTRLIPALGVAGATALYLRLLEHRLSALPRGKSLAIEIWCAPDCRHLLFQQQTFAKVSLHIQQGKDLGERMAYAASQALERYRNLVLIGIDCPALGSHLINQSLGWLDSGCDAVLGPAEDGGYVLLGLNRYADCLFDGLPWGTAEVADMTRDCFSNLGWVWRELPVLWDLDRPEDLPKLAALGWNLTTLSHQPGE